METRTENSTTEDQMLAQSTVETIKSNLDALSLDTLASVQTFLNEFMYLTFDLCDDQDEAQA